MISSTFRPFLHSATILPQEDGPDDESNPKLNKVAKFASTAHHVRVYSHNTKVYQLKQYSYVSRNTIIKQFEEMSD